MIYITYCDLYSPEFGSGIRRKILGQIQTFKRFFGKVYHTCYMGKMIYLFDGEKQIEKELAITKQICNEIICIWLDKYEIKRTYIRYGFADKWFIQYLKSQKIRDIKSVIEIPTYPYDGEGVKGHVKIEDAYYRMDMYKYVDLVATNSNECKIWGIRCVPMFNGIDIDDYALSSKESHTEIVLIGVSSLVFWQGFERVIEGLYDYYKKDNDYDIYFKIVGDGPEKGYYCSLIEKYGLQSRVEILGNLEGEDLDKQYALSDIAVSSLGRYKSGVYDITPIKGAEYCARGVPFICGYHDMRFTGNERFIMNIPNNSEPVNMNQVIDFYKDISSHTEYHKRMREYAIKYLSWDTVMKPVIDYLK